MIVVSHRILFSRVGGWDNDSHRLVVFEDGVDFVPLGFSLRWNR